MSLRLQKKRGREAGEVRWVLLFLLKETPSSTTGWFQLLFLFTPNLGKDSHFEEYFSDGLVQPPTSFVHFQRHSIFDF